MQLGVVFPTCDIGNDPVAIRDFAQAAEELGYEQLVTYDHVLGAVHADREPKLWGPYTENDAFHEPFVLFGYLAGLTRSLELAVGVLVLPQRQTALVAKQAAEVDVLSDGRMRLGVGTGWNWVEYQSLGIDFDTRGRRMDEQIEVLRALWEQPTVTYAGEFHEIERAGILPQPTRSIPVWFGGRSERSYRRASRTGDGYIFGHAGDSARAGVDRITELLAQEGRDPSGFGFEGLVDYSMGADAWRDAYDKWRAAGGTHLSLRMLDTAAEFMRIERVGFSSVSQYIDAMTEFKEVVG